jgi:putative cardiolipin synthase
MAGFSRQRRIPAWLARICLLGCMVFSAACSTLPSLEGRSDSAAFSDTRATALGKVLEPMTAAHPGQSAVYPLLDARDAFAARAHLAQVAQRSLDVQYYIWHKDLTGTLLFDMLRAAADRGVRVRLLLDDNNTEGLDPVLAALDGHPNIEVRLFNPFVPRAPRWLGYLTDFSRANRRMHNKSFTADNQVSIVGGRNVGDEYFGAADGVLFTDVDVMAAGPVVRDVSGSFDQYWRSQSAYPVRLLLPPGDPEVLTGLAIEHQAMMQQDATNAYTRALRESPFVHELMEARLPVVWAPTRMVSDDPAKGLGRASQQSLVREMLKVIVGEPSSRISLVSPYFVPSAEAVDMLAGWSEQGMQVEILTNSLEATDVAAVHAGYAKRRRDLLDAGVTLYELRRLAPGIWKDQAHFGMGSSSASSLHAKTFAVDDTRVFVGSFNFDPRSALLNTEMGFVIDSPVLAKRVHNTFDMRVPEDSYRVTLAGDGSLRWTERQEGETVLYNTEPGTTAWQRFMVWLLSLLPIDALL